ncbi:MAG: efflux RND transporter permease subunit, partial [Polyangiaceae bacterium]|nr:efflux RND transporter permease subunit [Polyangiaceae bacterium]
EEFGAIVLRAQSDGSLLHLRDVARVELGSESYLQRGRFNGSPAVVLVIYQSPDSNALAAAANVREVMDELANAFPSDLRYAVSLDSTEAVAAGIEEIAITLGLALFLVVLVVYLFLESARATLIPALTVPISLIGACMVFPFAGFSINSLSLFGLVLAIGLVVDDAIVVVEAVQRKIEEGLKPRAATLAAMSEVANPVIAVALILSAVFVPVAFAGGITGRLYQQFALTIAISVLISAFNALTLSPALCAKLLRPEAKVRRGPLGRFFDAFDRAFSRTTNGYIRIVRFGIRRLLLSVLFLLAFTALAAFLGTITKPGYVPAEDQGFLFASFSLPEGASVERTDEAMREVERVLETTPGVDRYTTIVGYNFLAGASAPFFSLAFIGLDPWHDRDEPELGAAALAGRLNGSLAGIPSLQGVITPPPAIPGLGTTGGFSLYLQDVGGELSAEGLADEVNRFVAAANERPELTGVLSPYRATVPQRRAVIDEAQALRQGVGIEALYETLGTMLGGAYVNQFNRFGRTWNVYIEADEEFRAAEDALDLLYVRNEQNDMVPLSALVRLEEMNG